MKPQTVAFLSIVAMSLSPVRATYAAAAEITVAEVAKDIVVFRAPDIGNLYVEGNSVAVIGTREVLVFDTNARPSSALSVLSQIRRITNKPVRRVVNSHWHPDHWSGNGIYARAFPDVEIIATSATREYMARTAPSMRYTLRKGLKAHQRALASSATPRDEDRAALRVEEDFLAEFDQLDVVLPNVTFDGHLTLRNDGRTIELLTMYGDASSVAVAYLPREKVILAGDVIIYPLPYTPNGYLISRWLDSLKSVRALNVDTIVPGHGPVLKDFVYLDLLIELISAVKSNVEAALESGVLTADLQQAVQLPAVRDKFMAHTGSSAEDVTGFIQELIVKVAQESRDGAQFRP